MDSKSVNEPLLLNPSVVVEPNYVKKKKNSLCVSMVKLTLRVVMWVLFILWVAIAFVFPAQFTQELLLKWVESTSGNVFGITGSFLLLFFAPFLLISILSVVYLVVSGEEEFTKSKSSNFPRLRLWTFPLVVDGPFGVVSAAEFIGIFFFAAYVMWAVYAYTLRSINFVSGESIFKKQCSMFFGAMGLRLGSVGIYCLAFLFLPIARGSILLRLIDIPFEHATKYHVWLGHLTMVLFTLHGLFYVVAWTMEGRLLGKLLEWKDIGVANLPGVISLVAGLLMWVTSLPPVRKINFELFFYTHQLYVVFIIGLALHVGDFIFCIASAGIFLFMLDRFLRFCQSRKVVEILSAKCLPCGTVELVMSKPASLRYNALSFVFLQIRELSWLQWHPFSVSSSPLEGKYHMTVLIKVLGQWTGKLRESILNVSGDGPEEASPLRPHAKLTASVEGPYGHESPYHLMYENLVLVAGGIGISPFLAILSDVLRRVRDGKACLPRNITVIWAVKKSTELSLLSTVNMEAICPSFSDKLSIETHIFVTRESEPPLEDGKVVTTSNCPCFSGSKRCTMSGLVGTGHKVWSGLYIISSTLGFVVLMGLMDVFYINPREISAWWYKGLLLMVCMTASVVIFGGAVIGLWHLWETRASERETCEDNAIKVAKEQYEETSTRKVSSPSRPVDMSRVNYGARPDFKEIFSYLSKCWGCVDAGVLVCGPPALQTSVAKEIRSHNLRRESNHPIFHFNSHSFDL